MVINFIYKNSNDDKYYSILTNLTSDNIFSNRTKIK